MIGRLPKELNVNGTDRAIRSDFRVALLIFQAYNDPELTGHEKAQVMMECIYEEHGNIPNDDWQEAHDQAIWFLDGGGNVNEDSKHQQAKKVMDWEQDEQIIFSAVNKVASHETRAVEYMHWWTFLGFFNEIGEGLLSTVINIRQKKNKGKKLEKYELEFYRENVNLVELKTKFAPGEQEHRDKINELLR